MTFRNLNKERDGLERERERELIKGQDDKFSAAQAWAEASCDLKIFLGVDIFLMLDISSNPWHSHCNELKIRPGSLVDLSYFFGFSLCQMSETWGYPPLNDTAEAASRVHKALAERGWRIRP